MPEQILLFMILLLHQQGGKADSFEDVGEILRPNVRVGLLLFGYSYIMYRVEYYPCGGAV